MVGRHAPFQPLEPLVVPEDTQVLVAERLDAALGDLPDGGTLLRVGQADPVAQDLAHRVVARGAAEDEDDGGQHLALPQLLDHLGAQGGPVGQARSPSARLPVDRPALQGTTDRLVDAESFAAGPAVVVQQWEQDGLLVLPPVDGEMVAEHDRPLALDDHRGVAPDRAQPPAELVGVVDGGRQAHEADLGWRQDEDLLPHAAPVPVLNEVDLVEHDRVEPLQQVRAGQQHVAQDLGRHDHDRRSGAQGRVAGQEPDVLLAVGRSQFAVLLVRQGLEGRGVEGLAAGSEGTVDRVGGDQRLARARRGGHEEGVVGVEGPERLVLEVVEGEGQVGHERRRPARLLDGPREGRQRPSSFPMPMETK